MNSFSCECPAGFTGVTCETGLDSRLFLLAFVNFLEEAANESLMWSICSEGLDRFENRHPKIIGDAFRFGYKITPDTIFGKEDRQLATW